MRLIKLFGLAALTAMAAMAFIGASTASAGNTALCNIHSDPCPEANQLNEIEVEDTTGILKTSLVTVLCLSAKAKAKVEGANLANPLLLTVENLVWNNCGTGAAHNNCTVTTEKHPLFDVLRTALNLGEATALGAEVHVVCGALINCYYGGTVAGFSVEGALHNEGSLNGRLVATALAVPVVKGSFCPKTSEWTASFRLLGKHLFLTT